MGIWDFGEGESDVTTAMPRQFLKFSLGIDRIWVGSLFGKKSQCYVEKVIIWFWGKKGLLGPGDYSGRSLLSLAVEVQDLPLPVFLD
jgi:hypothetical protein